MLFYEIVVGENGISLRDAIYFSRLADAQYFIFVEAPNTFQQPLTAEDFVDAWDTAAEIVCGVEDGGIHISYLVGHLQKLRRNRLALVGERAAISVKLHSVRGPHRPMA